MIQTNDKIHSYYDSYFDDLTLLIKRGVKAYSDEVYNDIYLIKAESNDEVVGAQISYFSKRPIKLLRSYLPDNVYEIVEEVKSGIMKIEYYRQPNILYTKNKIYTFDEIVQTIKPIAKDYNLDSVYLFGSYARSEATSNSDLDFIIYGGDSFVLKAILGLNTVLHEVFRKKIDAFEIREIIPDSDLYQNIMKDKLLIYSRL